MALRQEKKGLLPSIVVNHTKEFGFFMWVMRKTGTTYEDLGKYVSNWTVPAHLPKLGRLFNPKRNKNNIEKGSFSSSASEFLTLVPLLLLYLCRIASVRDVGMIDYINSMIAALRVVEVLLAIRQGAVTPQALEEAIANHMRLFLAAWGVEWVVPKHHYARHLPDIMRIVGTLLGTLCNERRHRVAKRYTRDRKNTKRWSLGSLEEITCHHLWELSQPFLSRVGQLNTCSPKGKTLRCLRQLFPGRADAAFSIANKAKVGYGATCTRGDVVCFDFEGSRQVGRVMVHVAVDGEEVSIITKHTILRKTSDDLALEFACSEDLVGVPSASLHFACTYMLSANGEAGAVYLPVECR